MGTLHSGEAVSQTWGHRDRSCPLTPTRRPQPSQAAGGGTSNHGPGPQVPDGLRGGGSDLSGPFWAMAPSLISPSPPSQAALSHLWGLRRARGFQTACCHSHNFALLFSPPPLPHCAIISTVSPHCAFTPHPATHPLQ